MKDSWHSTLRISNKQKAGLKIRNAVPIISIRKAKGCANPAPYSSSQHMCAADSIAVKWEEAFLSSFYETINLSKFQWHSNRRDNRHQKSIS